MGVLRFAVHPPELLDDWPEIHSASISGLDGRAFPTRVEVSGNTVSVHRSSSDSGKLQVACPVENVGRPAASTCSLIERQEPYHLLLELARGKIARLREQAAAWENAGLPIPAEVRSRIREVQRLFTSAVAAQRQPDDCARLARDALQKGFDAADRLAEAYIEARMAARRRQSSRLPVSLGCFLNAGAPDAAAGEWVHFRRAFETAGIPVEWKEIEPEHGEYRWEKIDALTRQCRETHLPIYGGPLLDFSSGGFPDWLADWDGDATRFSSLVADFVETAISRYFGTIRIWEVAAYANSGGALQLNEESRLALVAQALDVARRIDEKIQLVIRVDQPGGEYGSRGEHRLSPLQFVDALLRSGIGLSGVNLEINTGYQRCGDRFRDRLDLSRLIDTWSLLGIPLAVTLAVPGGVSDDPRAAPDLEVDPRSWKAPWNEALQAEWIEQFLPLLMAKESVVRIFWRHFSDARPHRAPHAGLLRTDGSPKPALERLVQFREE